jgi:hypothetical protein
MTGYELDNQGKEVQLDRSAEETEYISRMQIRRIVTKIADTSFKNVMQFIYFGTTVTDQNLIQEEIEKLATTQSITLKRRN